MSHEKEIRELITRMARSAGQRPLLMVAEVESVQGDTCTVKVGTLSLSDVRLCAVADGHKGNLLITPKKGSMVLVADLSGGELRELAVMAFSQTDTITVNGGEFGGLVKIAALTNKLNALKDTVNDLVQAFNTHTHTVATTGTAAAQSGTATPVTTPAQQAAAFVKDDYEDIKIKH